MSTQEQNRAPRVRPFSAYYTRPPASDHGALADVNPDTPSGEYLRRYWHPFMLGSELKDLPKAVRLLGEDLVVFRDRGGRIGLLHRNCIHRGASLEFGIPVERGIMCCYHGWHFDVDGTILATPAEPETSNIRHNFCQGAYRVHEYSGILFAYMGPPELTPEFPIYDSFIHPAGTRLIPFQMHFPCNWLQIVENAADPIHNQFLHAIVSQQFSAGFNVSPALDFVETPIGYLSMATRRVKDFVFVRASDMILPNISQFTRGSRKWHDEENFTISSATTRWAVPIDNHNSFYMGFTHVNGLTEHLHPVREQDIGVGKSNLIGQTGDRPYEERQREPGDWDALTSQGLIANRANEHLGTTDRGVVLSRRQLTRAINAVKNNEVPVVPRLYREAPVRTYCHEIIFRLPAGSNISGVDSVGEFGRRAAEIVIETDDIGPEERERVVQERVRRLLGTVSGEQRQAQ
jgi:phenylpropionate dioxygenase-like ring-hydroxylating dioxygenase large terminal subunit